MKRRDFLKGVLGAIGAGIGAAKILPEAQAVESAEVVEEAPKVIDSFKTWEGEYQLLSDGTQMEISGDGIPDFHSKITFDKSPYDAPKTIL